MTASLLFLLGIVAIAMVWGAWHNTRRIKTVLAKHNARNHLPKAVTALIITVQLSELVKVVDHVSITNVVGALLLLSIMLATKAGTEGELKS